MSAAVLVQEPSAKYLVNLQPPLVRHFDLIAQAPGGVVRLRELILTLAVQGKLVPQDPSDEPASELLKKIRAEKDRLIAEGKIKRDKALAEITHEEKTFELPEGWHWMRLASVGDWAIGSGFPVESQGLQNLPVLFAKVSDMNLPGNEKFIYSANNSIDYATVDKLRVNVHGAGTVVFPKIGGAIATNKRRILVKPTAIDNNCLGITPSAGIATSYLYLLLTSIDFTKYQAGTSVPALSQGTLGQIVIGLPPLAEQSRIVTRVEELMQVCDALEVSGQLEAQQHAQLVDTLLGTLTQSETPEALADNWQRIATHFDLLLVPWVTSGETGQPFIRQTEQHVTDAALTQTSLTIYPVGTLVVAMYGQGKTRGQISELCIPATTNQACAAIVLVEPSLAHKDYVKLVFEKSYDEIRELSAGGAQPNLNVGKVKATLISLPPLNEQFRIVTRVNELRSLCADLRYRLAAGQEVQSQLVDALVAG